MGISKLTRRAFLRRTALSLPALAALKTAAAQGMTQGMGTTTTAAPEMLPPPPPAARPRRVIVVGAGLAGLAAAYELAAWGHDVTVLEAQTRPGGRVLTLRSFADGLFAEAGAIDFTESARRMKHYVKALGLTTSERQPTDLITPFHLRGQRVLDRPGIKTRWPYEFSEEEKKLPGFFQMYQKYLGQQANELGDPTDPKWDIQAFKQLDQVTVADFMKSRGASDEAVEYLSHQMVPGYGWWTGSALHRLASDFALYNKGGGRNHFIDGGSDMLPRAFAKSLRDRIYYGAPVSRIVQEGGKVRAVFRPGGSGPEESLEADYLICTAPCPVLRRTEFSPGLSPRKRMILRELEYTPVTRIFVQTRTRFWLDQNLSGGGNTDLPIKVVAEHPFVRPADTGKRGILECHIRGADAVPVDAMDMDEQIAFAVAGLEKLHPGLSRYVEGGTAYSWHNDPWAGGGYPWWKPGQLTEWMPELARAEGRVHFAGEHASVLPRTMEGALISAERAAREVHEAASREA